MNDEITVASSSGFEKGDVLCINGDEGHFIIADITGTTLTIKPRRWWHRLWSWVRRLWPF